MKQRLGYLVGFALVLASCGEQVVVRETRATCGNGQVEVDEACDDGNDVNSDACSNACEARFVRRRGHTDGSRSR